MGENHCIYFDFLVQLCQSSHKLTDDYPHLYRKHHAKTGRTKLWRNTRERESKTRSAFFIIPADKTLSLSCRRIMILGAQLGAPSVFIRP